ncbi:crossover junction endonuclease MUS81 [Wyeomyia smithii]|uniref:crossover junction endonuclease MUS81 n=1 Tax=Wyeomyia smithii TaxID=174621 RepID=UPI002467C37F|nr:crossover junction endonuclease MUS81 [Wyeomyia smithii]XP_055544669.1 crossover junction endonuclease MUS81 [Wyeomyia smithii]
MPVSAPQRMIRKIRVNRQLSAASDNTVRQISCKIKCPNPLFERWLQEMLSKAEEQNSMSRIPLQKALNSLRRYPLPIASGRDCFMLLDFGRTICELLEKRLQAYRQSFPNEQTFASKIDTEAEKILNDKNQCYYHQLTAETPKLTSECEQPEAVIDDDQFNLPNDSIYNSLDIADCQNVIISNPQVILFVDTQEIIGKSKSYLDRTLKELEQYHVPHEVKRLGVGDFLWIIRDNNGREFILPYIVERKRMDDLASSLKDGRFHEQKFRLKQCRLANVIYLIEHLGNNRQVGVPAGTLSQAALNTYVHGFTVKYTENHHHTVQYLSVMTKLLQTNLKDKTFWNITKDSQDPVPTYDFNQQRVPLLQFEVFNTQSSKTRECTVREIFMKQLLQIKLLTIDKVNAIVERYPTPKKLYLAFEKCCSEQEKERLLNLPYGPTKRTIGLKLSAIIYQLFMNDVYQR